MPDDQRTNAFRPAQPSIPGVPTNPAKSRTPEQPIAADPNASRHDTSARHLIWIVAGAVAVCSVGGALFVWNRMASLHAGAPLAPAVTPAPTIAAEPVKPIQSLPVGPGPVATTEELVKAWASKRFVFPDSVTGEPVPAMVVHLPNGSYWAFSLREPYGGCALDYVTNLRKLREDYSFSATRPMVVNTCNRSVYDLLRYGGTSDSSLVRGDVVQGPAIRPPLAIEVRVQGNHVVAVRME
jgi:hypothetical protein